VLAPASPPTRTAKAAARMISVLICTFCFSLILRANCP